MKTVLLMVLAAVVGAVVADVYGGLGIGEFITDKFEDPVPCPVKNSRSNIDDQYVLSADVEVVISGNDVGESGREISFWICRDKVAGPSSAEFWYYGTNSSGEPLLMPVQYDAKDDRYSAHGYSVDCPEKVWIIPVASGGFYEFDDC